MNERSRSNQTKLLLYTIGVAVVLLIGVYFWKEIAVDSQMRAMEQQREEMTAELEQAQQQLRQASADRIEEDLRLLALPLGWAIRTEAVAKNFDKIEEYVVRLVKEPRVRRVVLAMPDGKIRITTDKKLQDEPASRFFGDLASGDQITLRKDDNGDYHLLVPITGYNAKLASLIVTVTGD